jgi:diguanylate cyclase (GGDEF)-like protein
MYDAALRDGLTRAYNRRYFMERLESEFRFAQRHSVPLSLLMLDLDHFKRINDSHGHLAGDHVLGAFAKHVQRTIRNEDVFARYGGEEFAIISRALRQDDARRFADRLRNEIEHLNIVYRDQQIPLTVSIGISGLPEGRIPNATALLGAADRALYRAKSAGRNAVAVFHDEDFEEPTKP